MHAVELDILFFWSTSFKEQAFGFPKIMGTVMKFFQRKNKAIKKWHSRAMIIDLSKTKVTIIRKRELDNFDLSAQRNR